MNFYFITLTPKDHFLRVKFREIAIQLEKEKGFDRPLIYNYWHAFLNITFQRISPKKEVFNFLKTYDNIKNLNHQF
jgi:hypothetical protein